MPINSFLYPAPSTPTFAYNVANSLRFDDGSSDFLQQSTTAGTQTTWTFSFWIKRGNIGSTQHIVENDLANYHRIRFTSGDVFEVFDSNSNHTWNWNGLFRDVSAWYHIVLRADSTDGTNGNRLRLYVNGSLASANTVASISQNYTFSFNQGGTLYLGKRAGGEFFDGYIAEMVFIDGTSLDPTSFGEFDSDSPNIWKPIDVSGLTFGNEGFYLQFKESGTSQNSSGLGADTSGNGNHFAVNNLTAVDQSTDTCTNNFATFNPLDKAQSSATYSEGNLKWTTTSGYFWNRSTIGVSSGKWYFEAKLTSAPDHAHVGIVDEAPDDNSDSIEGGTYNWGYKNSSGEIYNNGSGSSYGSTYTTGDIIGVYLDLDNNKLYFAKNGAIQNSGTGISITASGSTDTGNYFFAVGDNASGTNGTWEANFGSPAFSISSGNSDPNGYGNFEYSPNDGGSASFDSTAKSFYALNTKNLAEFG